MELQIPVFTAIRYMVHDLSGPLRGFYTKAEAERFADGDSSYTVVHVPQTTKTLTVEEAPF